MMMMTIIIYRHILHLHMTCLHSLWRTFLIFSRSEYTDELTVRRKFCIASGSCAAVCAITFRGVIRVITTVCVVFFLVVTHLPCKTLWDFFLFSFFPFFFSFFFLFFLFFGFQSVILRDPRLNQKDVRHIDTTTTTTTVTTTTAAATITTTTITTTTITTRLLLGYYY